MEKFVAALLFIVLAVFVFMNYFDRDLNEAIDNKTQSVIEVIDGTNVE